MQSFIVAVELTRLGYSYMRRVQERFGKESAAAMVRAVQNEAE